MVTPGAMEAVGKYVSTQDGDYLQRICGNTFYYMTERDIQDMKDLTYMKPEKNLDFCFDRKTDKAIRDITEEAEHCGWEGIAHAIQ